MGGEGREGGTDVKKEIKCKKLKETKHETKKERTEKHALEDQKSMLLLS